MRAPIPLVRLPRPLDSLTSFKLKVALIVGIVLLLASVTFWIGASWQFRYTLLAALVVSIAATQLVAHGMTSPLREMTAAARAMARGDYSTRVRASSRDEVGQLAEAFNTMSADLEAADTYRRELIGNVSHELKTPIAALRAVLENMVDGVTEPDPATLNVALRQTEKLGDLVTELLDLSRLEGGVLPLRPERFGVHDFLGAVASEYGRVRVVVTPHQLQMSADRSRVQQIVTNLLSNAVEHSPPGSAVTVSAMPAPEGVRIEVSDDGPGISPSERFSVFDRFTRGGATGGGTGLGLAIARWATELHGGTIEVLDRSPGCHIRVCLPQN
ncbi:HAMP domain-containing sensor histidine kinase [Rhodococcus sp. 14-2470-1a]|uniref:sensor histidine kinase n=1 Tax=Rhodococcus sp. 14-2470-1a TaxID=2023150 RepID=UPI000B9C6601|nr:MULTISPECIES: HAMP domain-containing sensor histidine kinase [unclassified Rhodococcus (in: high G+C Gram-positive bacteria)]OZC46384.1 two-component sensor histidine kinase [Rhodococcus sp. 06-621-2]OZF09774.1 two-component sensor histidine kinase [Rhodococcus sp. 15-1154-1]OZF57748.1 two-component sensor histidine kinase [Rhodococcus sp. 14-2470-1a]